MDLTADLYELLGVRPDASTEDIRAAYLKASKMAHPDHGGTAAIFRLVQKSYETLSDPQSRAEYDAIRATRPKARAANAGPSAASGGTTGVAHHPDPMVRRCPVCGTQNRLNAWVTQSCGRCGAVIVLVDIVPG